MTYRISRHQMAMQCAEVVAKRATCFRRNVGAIITVDHHIVSHGYNGPPAGEPHCTGAGCAHPTQGCQRAVHAEENALRYLPRPFHKGRVWRFYTTESPCAKCAAMITGFPIKQLFYLHQYRLTEGLTHLLTRNVEVYRLTPAGHCIDYKTDQLVDVPE